MTSRAFESSSETPPSTERRDSGTQLPAQRIDEGVALQLRFGNGQHQDPLLGAALQVTEWWFRHGDSRSWM